MLNSNQLGNNRESHVDFYERIFNMPARLWHATPQLGSPTPIKYASTRLMRHSPVQPQFSVLVHLGWFSASFACISTQNCLCFCLSSVFNKLQLVGCHSQAFPYNRPNCSWRNLFFLWSSQGIAKTFPEPTQMSLLILVVVQILSISQIACLFEPFCTMSKLVLKLVHFYGIPSHMYAARSFSPVFEHTL